MAKNKQKQYVNIPLPYQLANQIDRIIKSGECGYRTKSEFVKEAVREKLRESIKLKALRNEIKKYS